MVSEKKLKVLSNKQFTGLAKRLIQDTEISFTQLVEKINIAFLNMHRLSLPDCENI